MEDLLVKIGGWVLNQEYYAMINNFDMTGINNTGLLGPKVHMHKTTVLRFATECSTFEPTFEPAVHSNLFTSG